MDFIQRTIDLAMANVEQGGRPFACVIVKDGHVLAEGVNRVAQTHDPTAHAEIVAIREAAAILQSENFGGCEFSVYRRWKERNGSQDRFRKSRGRRNWSF